MTKGEYRVGIDFNPSGDDTVGRIKKASADLIDMVEKIPSDRTSQAGQERARLKALAQTDLEKAAMWAVKAATKREPNAAPPQAETAATAAKPAKPASKRKAKAA